MVHLVGRKSWVAFTAFAFAELDHDALNFVCLEEYLCPDVVGNPDGWAD